jgi:hypothetical protein
MDDETKRLEEIIKETSASQREDIKQLSYNVNKLAEHIRENSNDINMAVQAISAAVSAKGDKYELRNGKGPSAWIGYLLAFVTPMIFVIASIREDVILQGSHMREDASKQGSLETKFNNVDQRIETIEMWRIVVEELDREDIKEDADVAARVLQLESR